MAATTPVESLASKVARIANVIGEKEPQRHSRDIKFPYHSARDVYGWWRPLLHAEGIIVVPRAESVEVLQATLPRSSGGTRTTFVTTMRVTFTFMDGTTGEVIEGSAVGQGEDPSDKGSGKAMTYAEKAFLLGLGMNGSESDVEAYPDTEQRGAVVVGDSDIQGIARGGRTTGATDIQVQRFRQLSRDLGFGAVKAAEVAADVLGRPVPLPEDPDDAGPALVRFVTGLPADDLGNVIRYMEAMTGGDDADASGS